MTVIELPFPPSVNNLFVNSRRGRFTSQKYETWKQEAGWELQRQRPPQVAGMVVLFLEFGAPDKRKHDLDNLLKAPLDLLVKHGVIEADDNSVLRGVHASWSEAVRGCRVTVEQVG